MKMIDLTGRRFGRLTVLKHSGGQHWQCICDCGTKRDFRSQYLRTGRSKSCGCLAADITANRNKKHGLSKTPEYRIWSGIKTRCYNSNATHYGEYGGRGIKMDALWRESFLRFLADMGPMPAPEYSIERRDVNGDYCPSNCYWLERRNQGKNRRNTVYLTHQGETLSLFEWAERTCLRSSIIRERLKLGWTESEALTIPKKAVRVLGRIKTNYPRRFQPPL